jgi:hypothetical protein
MKLEFPREIFEKYSNIKFHENPSSGSRVVPYGQTDGQIDMTKLIAAFSNLAKAPKNAWNLSQHPYLYGIHRDSLYLVSYTL